MNYKLYKFVKKVLQTYIKQYRPFFVFLLRFFTVYIVLTVAYQFYLSIEVSAVEPDAITQWVASQTEELLRLIGYTANVRAHGTQPSMMLILNNIYVARIVEGCNAVSVIILFAAFVVAFKGTLKRTILFVLGGTIIIHILNVIRIVLLSMALLRYPQYEHMLHGVVFPLFIYGVVFALWVLWVNKFSEHAVKNS